MGVEARGDAPRAAGAGQLLDPHRVVQMVTALAAVALGELQPEKAQLRAAPVQLTRELPRRLPLLDVRRDLPGDETADGLPQLLMLLAKRRQRSTRTGVLDDGQGYSP